MRRKTDQKESLNSWLITLSKAAISLFFLGGLSFIGTWAIGMGATIASVREDVQSLKEKERLMNEMVYPQLMDQVKQLRGEMRDLSAELKQVAGRKR